jgi:hypothetical protein
MITMRIFQEDQKQEGSAVDRFWLRLDALAFDFRREFEDTFPQSFLADLLSG